MLDLSLEATTQG